MKRLLFCLLLCSQASFGQSTAPSVTHLSEQAEISVVTIGPTQEELFSAFGHSAIRVYDPLRRMDDFYNYGVFSFNQPFFYLNFARGNLNYMLGVDPYSLYRNHYINSNRYVHEQVLNLTLQQKQKVFDFLRNNALPENAYYRYDYFYNNCATMLRDIMTEIFQDSVQFNGDYVSTRYSIRQLTDIYLKQQPWGDLGIDICLGLPMDKKASPYEYMFLPDYIESGFDHASIRRDSLTLPLVKEKISVYEAAPEASSFSVFHPWIVFGLVLLLVISITVVGWKRNKSFKWVDGILFGVTGILGLLLLVLWVATDHKAAARNMNILWAMPLHLVFLPMYFRNSMKAVTYFRVITGLNLLLLLSWAWLPQQLNVYLIPLVIALTLRAAWIGWGSASTQMTISNS